MLSGMLEGYLKKKRRVYTETAKQHVSKVDMYRKLNKDGQKNLWAMHG